MSDETRHAFFLGTEARRESRSESEFEVNDPLMYYWIKGRLGMQYRNQEVRTLKDIIHDLRQKMASIKAKNAMPADEFNTAKMNKALDELNDMKLRYAKLEGDKTSMQATINNLSAKLSKAGRSEKRKSNRV